MTLVADRIENYRARAKAAAAASPNPIQLAVTDAPVGGMFSDVNSRNTEQYKHNVGWVYTAVARIATRASGQPVHVGRPLPSQASAQVRHWVKQHGFVKVDRMWQKARGCRLMTATQRKAAPYYVKNSPNEFEIVENHEFLDLLDDPNELLVKSSLFSVTVASLELTGKGRWWMPREQGRLRLWHLPSDWVTARHTKEKMYVGYNIRLPGSAGEPIPVPKDEVVAFNLPDPSDPHGVVAPAQTQAPAIAADEALQVSQARTFKNDINPGLIIRMARPIGFDGKPGPRPMLQGHQRKDIIEAILSCHQGVVNHRHPVILDGMIDGVERATLTPAEMDYLRSGQITKGRIMQGFGVNPILSGEVVSVGWGQASVADTTFCDNIVNPLTTFMGEVISRHPLLDGYVLWFEEAVSRNPELTLKKLQLALNNKKGPLITDDEFRLIALNLGPLEEDDLPDDDEPMDDGSGQPDDLDEPPKKPVPEE